jgi:hypothetical protein
VTRNWGNSWKYQLFASLAAGWVAVPALLRQMNGYLPLATRSVNPSRPPTHLEFRGNSSGFGNISLERTFIPAP